MLSTSIYQQIPVKIKELWKKLMKGQCLSKEEEKNGTGLDTHREEVMTASTSRHYSGYHKATEE